jgi:hypothetical protein
MKGIENIKVDFTFADFSNTNEGSMLNMDRMFYGFCYTEDTNSLS